MTTTEILLWDVLPYVAITTFIVGTIWRYRYDKFGWTTRSSQLYERKLIRIASPLFHLGILAVLMGHIVGLLIPEAWTDAVGVSETMYHVMAVSLGFFAGAATLVGIVLLIYRRRTVGPVFAATTKNDKTMYVFLVAAISLGLLTTMVGAGVIGDGHNYREDVSVWFRSILTLQPQGELMADAPFAFRIHAVAGMLVFMIWPFTRLVHAFSAPLLYLFRPYVVYRDRGPHDQGSHAPRRGWEKIGSYPPRHALAGSHSGRSRRRNRLPATTKESLMEHITALDTLIEVAPESTVSRTVLKAEGARVVLFAFDAGQELSEHTAAVPILLQVLDGHLRVGADGEHVDLSPGGLVHIGARVPHEILAMQPSRMVLTMLDPRSSDPA